MENTYYIHINSNALPHYLVDGIIRPANLIKNRENDFQNNSGNQIILSIKKWNSTTDCSIEIVLNNKENEELEQISKNFLLCHTALPISRIRSIFFENRVKAEGIIWNINNTVAFVPNWAIQYANKKDDELAEEYPNYTTKADNTKELSIALKRFDRLLGGFAFLKVSPEINSNNTINFSESYLSTLAFFNKRIESDLKKNNLTIDDKFHKIFKGDSEIFNYLARNINATLVEEIAKKEGVKVKTKFSVIDLNLPHETLTFKLAVLETYGKDNSKSVEDLITGLLQKLNKDISEEIALIFGLYVGYNTLRNYYKIENQNISVKYDLNSKIDFYTVESIYQYAFNDKLISNDFDYLRFNFLPAKNKYKKNPEFKYIKILNEYYPSKKIDYKEQKMTIIDILTKEISKWFPSELFKINEDRISEKISILINPKLNDLISEIRKDAEESFEINSLREDTTSSTEIKNQDEKVNIIENHYTPPNKENNVLRKVFVNIEPSLFNNETEIKSKVFNAMELDSFTIPKLKDHAEELNIKIPKSITKKNDIIKIILSNQD